MKITTTRIYIRAVEIYLGESLSKLQEYMERSRDFHSHSVTVFGHKF
jgi:hypothetical protein